MEENKDIILQYANEFGIPEETVSNTLSIEGDSYLDYITNALKKKRTADSSNADYGTDEWSAGEPDRFEVRADNDTAVARPKFFGIGYYSDTAFYGIGIDASGIFWYKRY